MSKWIQDMLPLDDWADAEVVDGDDDSADDDDTAGDGDVTTDAFIKGALEGRVKSDPAPIPQTAFVVIIDANGEAEAYADPRKFPKYTQRPASFGDIRRACNEIVTEINLQTATRMTVQAMGPEDPRVKMADSLRTALHNRGVNLGR